MKDIKTVIYPNEDEIDALVDCFIRYLNVSNDVKNKIAFGFQEGLYKMIDVIKQKNEL